MEPSLGHVAYHTLQPSVVLRRTAGAFCACLLWLAPASAASVRAVRVELSDPAGRPLAGFPVLVACDEKDVLGHTDQHGYFEVRTRSAEVAVLAPPLGGVSVRSARSPVQITVEPATLARAASTVAARAGVPRAGSGRGPYPSLFWAGSNDAPNSLVRGSLQGTALSFLPEVASGGSASGSVSQVTFNQVRVVKGAPGACSLVAQTNDASSQVSIYRVDPGGGVEPVPGSPFGVIASPPALAWAPDGGALYVAGYDPDEGVVDVLRVFCTPGGPVSVTRPGAVLLGFSRMRDVEVVGPGTGTHLCLSANLGIVGCVPIDPVTRLPGLIPVNGLSVSDPYGLRFGSNRCGIVGRGDGSVQALRAEASGALTATNVAAPGLPAAGRFAAVSPDGAFAALGYGASLVALFGLDAATCQASLLDLGFTFLTGSAAYVAFDEQNRLFVAETNANSVRVFQASAAGLAELAVAPTGHPVPTGPAGIDAALQSSVPVELQGLHIE